LRREGPVSREQGADHTLCHWSPEFKSWTTKVLLCGELINYTAVSTDMIHSE